MMYYSILASFCLLGMAGSQNIETVTACVTKEQNLKIECKYTIAKQGNITCTYEADKKVVGTTGTQAVDPTFKNRGTVLNKDNICTLQLTGFSDDKPKMYNCTIKQEKTVTMGTTVDKKSLATCSAGSTHMHGGVILLLAFVLPLLSRML